MEEELVERVGLKGSSNTKGCKRMRLRAHPGKVWEARQGLQGEKGTDVD